MSQNPCRSVQVVTFSPLANSQSSTSPLNCLKRSFIKSRAWPTAVRIRSLTKHTGFCQGADWLGNARGCEGELTLFWDGLVFHFSLPVDAQVRQPVGLAGYFRPEVRDVVLSFHSAGRSGRGFYRRRSRGGALRGFRLRWLIGHILRLKLQH